MPTVEQLIAEAGIKPVNRSQPPAETPTPPVETPTPPAETPKPPDTPPTIDKYKIISETFGQEFKTDEDITNWRNSYDTKIKDYETKEEQWARERAELEAGVDPMSYFASPELFTLNGLLKKYPDKNPVILTEISTRDFKDVHLKDPVDILALDLMLENPGIYANRTEAMEDVLAEYQLSTVKNENGQYDIDAQSLRRMQVKAKSVVDKVNGIKSQIEQPRRVDLTAERAAKIETETQRTQKMTEATEPLFTKIIPGELKEIDFPIVVKSEDGKEETEIAFKYDIGDNFAKSKAVQTILNTMRTNAIKDATEWTPAREAALKEDTVGLLKAIYTYNNRKDIYNAIRDDLFAKFHDEAWMKKHNVRPLRQEGTIPKPDEKEVKAERQRQDFLKSRGIKIT